MVDLFPEFNAGEVAISSMFSNDQKDKLADMLRSLTAFAEGK
jgi:hypothetical protein